MLPVTLPAQAVDLAEIDAPARPTLYLAPPSTAPAAPGHLPGAPETCSCRDCAMARHPAAAARLQLVPDA